MARNLAFQMLRGSLANMPALSDGEFYFAMNTGQLYVGFNGGTLPVGNKRAIQLQDGTVLTQLAAIDASGNVQTKVNNFPATQNVSVTSDTPLTTGAGSVSLGTSTGKSAVLKTGQLTTTAVTANQVVLTYTVTAGKTLYLEYIDIQSRLTVVSATASVLGTVIIQIGGVTVYTATFVNPTTSDQGSQAVRIPITEPIPIAAGTVVAFLTTPAATTSMLWTANFGGYEK